MKKRERVALTVCLGFVFLIFFLVNLADTQEPKKPEPQGKVLIKAITPLPYNGGEPSNTYLIGCSLTQEAVLIDAGTGTDELRQFIKEHKLKLKYIILTHCHGDHMAIVGDFSQTEPKPQVLSYGKKGCKHGDLIEVGSLTFEVIHTPGHSEDSMCLYLSNEMSLFTGDSFDPFINNAASLKVEEKLKFANVFTLPDDTMAYSGHGGPQPGLLKSWDAGRGKTLIQRLEIPVPWSGIQTQSWNSYFLKKEKKKTPGGLLVSEVESGSPAAEVGLQKDELITKFNGVKVTNPVLLRDMVIKAGVGKEAKITIVRDKKEQNLTLKIGEKK